MAASTDVVLGDRFSCFGSGPQPQLAHRKAVFGFGLLSAGRDDGPAIFRIADGGCSFRSSPTQRVTMVSGTDVQRYETNFVAFEGRNSRRKNQSVTSYKLQERMWRILSFPALGNGTSGCPYGSWAVQYPGFLGKRWYPSRLSPFKMCKNVIKIKVRD